MMEFITHPSFDIPQAYILLTVFFIIIIPEIPFLLHISNVLGLLVIIRELCGIQESQ